MKKAIRKQPRMKSFDRFEQQYAATLMLSKQWEEAYETLLPILDKYPYDVVTLQLMNDASFEVDDMITGWITSYRLVELLPDESIGYTNASIAASRLGLPFTAVHYAELYLQRWGNDADANEIRQLKKTLEEICETTRKHDPVNTARPNAELSLLEQGQFFVSVGDLQEGREICQRIIEIMPDVAAPYNNLSLSYVIEGNLPEALRIAQQAIERFPDNFYARCNLAQLLARVGRRSEAEKLVETLNQDLLPEYSLWEKLFETLTYLCDDAAVVNLYQQSQKNPDLTLSPMIKHLIAVAFARTGDQKSAEEIWEAILADDPDIEIAADNLDDIKQTPGEQSGAWPFTISQWFSYGWLEQLLTLMTNVRNEQAASRKIERLIRDTFGMETTLQMMLERGDPEGRELAIRVCSMYPVKGLVEFVQGSNGTDSDRLIASEAAVTHGLLPRGVPVKMFRQGEQTELLFLNYEIHGESDKRQFPKPVQRLYTQSTEAVHNKDFERALQLAQEANTLLPDNPMIMNQMAVSLIHLNKNVEGEAILRKNAELHPDYLFARCGMANLCVREGKLEEAKEWLSPLLKRSRFHLSEFNMLAHAQAELLRAEGQQEGARSWLNMLEDTIAEPEPIPPKRKTRMR